MATTPVRAANAAIAPTALPPTEAPDAPGIGDRVERGDTALTVVGVERVASAPNGGQAFTPKDGNELLLIEVLIEYIGGDASDYNRFYFELKDADGFAYEQTTGFSPEHLVVMGELAPAEKFRGVAPFEVKAGVTDLTLGYQRPGGERILIALD